MGWLMKALCCGVVVASVIRHQLLLAAEISLCACLRMASRSIAECMVLGATLMAC